MPPPISTAGTRFTTPIVLCKWDAVHLAPIPYDYDRVYNIIIVCLPTQRNEEPLFVGTTNSSCIGRAHGVPIYSSRDSWYIP